MIPQRPCTEEWKKLMVEKGEWKDTYFVSAGEMFVDNSGMTYEQVFFAWQGNCSWIPIWCEILS